TLVSLDIRLTKDTYHSVHEFFNGQYPTCRKIRIPPPTQMAGEFGSRIIPQVSFEKIFISKSIVHSSEKSNLRIPIGSSADRFITYRKIELRVIIVDQFRLPAPVAFPFITHHIGSCRKL